MALYDDASFIFLASAAAGLETKDASKVYNVKPVETLSSTQIVQGGDFSDASQWTLDSNVTIADNKVTFAGSGTQDVNQASGITLGNKKVKVTFTAHDITAGSVNAIFYSSGGTSTVTPSISTNGNHSAVVTIHSSANNNVGLRGSTDFRGKISNFSVREVTAEGADFTISRDANLDATRVGPTGLIEKGREQLLVNTVFAGLTTNGKPTNYNNSITTGSGSLSPLDSDSTKIKFEVTNASGGRFYVNETVSNTNLICTSVFVDEVTGTAPEIRQIVRSFSSNAGVTRTIIHAALKDGEVVSGTDTVVAGHRYGIVCSYDGSSVHRFGLGTNSSFTAVGSVTLSQPQVEIGIVPTAYIENTSTSATATAGIKEDEPRFDYPVAGGAPALLIEPERKNELSHSEYFTFEGRTTITYNHDLSPEGVKNSTRYSNTTETGAHRTYSSAFNATGSTTYTASVFAKKGTLKKLSFTIKAANESDNGDDGSTPIAFNEAIFDLNDGSISGSSTGASMVNYGNGWYRCIMTDAVETAVTGARMYFYFREDDGTKSYTGATSENMEIYGMQVEEGANATSYIPCHGAAATRSPDTLPEIDLNANGITLGTSVTVFLEASKFSADRQTSFLQLRTGTDSNNRFLFFSNTSAVGATHDINVQHRQSGTAVPKNKSGLTRGDFFKCIGRVDGTTLTMFINGEMLTPATIVATDVFDKISLIRNGDVTDQSGHKIKSVIVFPSAISNLDALVLTDTNYGSYSEMVNSLSYNSHG